MAASVRKSTSYYSENDEVYCEEDFRNNLTFKNSFDGFDDQFSYLIKNYIQANSLCVIYGAEASYKSFLALCWAVHIALGREWNRHRVNQAPVLYIAGEGGVGIPRRIKALADRYNDGRHIKELYRLDYAVPFADSAMVGELIHRIKGISSDYKQKFGLVVIDTLARCFGGDENSSQDMNQFVTACDRIRSETQATVLLIHHSGRKDKNRARGSSVLGAAADSEFRVERESSDTPVLLLTGTKSKDEKEPPPQSFELSSAELFTDSDGDIVETLVCSDVGIDSVATQDQTVAGLGKYASAVYFSVRANEEAGRPTDKSSIRELVREKLPAKVDKGFSVWIKQCVAKGVLEEIEGKLSTRVIEKDG
ncbi:AAA family ATPase [Microbulbifer aggregans]|uniref:AAA family ATPase n=1 Tax=Microbulbifer aggregans TaxID=1769779 RepID=UPI001CFE97C4|nr:helicase RepA family protein [Microbulbifer aggregans]